MLCFSYTLLSTLPLIILNINTLVFYSTSYSLAKNEPIGISVDTNPSFDSFPVFFGNTDTDVSRKPCPPLSQPHHGYSSKVIGSDGVIKSMGFSCNNSYVLIGNTRRTCQLDGTWSGRQPQCIKGIYLFDIS